MRHDWRDADGARSSHPRARRAVGIAAGAGAPPPLAALHAHGRLRRGSRDPDHRARRGLLRLRRARHALPRRAVVAVLRQRGPRPARAGGGRGGPDPRAGLLHELELRPSAGDRARRTDRRPGAARAGARVLHERRLGGRRVGVEARPRLPRPARRAGADEDRRARARLPRQLARRARRDRPARAEGGLRAGHARRLPRAEHLRLPLAGGARPAVGGRRDRAADRRGGPRDRRRGDPRAGPERRRLLRRAGRLLRARARDLRPPRRAAHLRRGHLLVGPARVTCSAASASATCPTSSRPPRA